MTIILRSSKGLPLTQAELDGNFTDLDNRIGAMEAATVTSVNGQTGAVVISTSEVAEGTNLYYTSARFAAAFASKSTSDLSEGTNLYFTTSRARASISGTGGISYNSSTGVISIGSYPNTDSISEGSGNLYYTDTRVNSLLATTPASILADISYPSAPNNGEVLTWNNLSNNWEPAVPPGATGGEANTMSNLGAGQGLFANKLGTDLRLYSLGVGAGMTISAPTANVVTISTSQDLSTTGTPSFTSIAAGNTVVSDNAITTQTVNGNLSITGNGTGYVKVDSAAGLVVSSGNLIVSNIATTSNANVYITPNGTGKVIAANLAISSATINRVFYSGVIGTVTDNANLTFDGSSLGLIGTLTTTGSISATVSSSAGNVSTSGNTISSTNTNGNINLTPNGTGKVVISSAVVSDLSDGRLVYVGAGKVLADSTGLTFNGLDLSVNRNITSVIGNVSGVNFTASSTVTAAIGNISVLTGGNLQLTTNTMSSINTNGNINLTPNGTGRVGINTATPAYLFDVNGSVGSKALTVVGTSTLSGAVVLGASSSDNITVTGSINSAIIPTNTNTSNIGSVSNKFRSAFFGSNLQVDGSTTLGDSKSDSFTINASIASDMTPAFDDSYDIGTSLLRFSNIYAVGADMGSVGITSAGSITVSTGDITASVGDIIATAGSVIGATVSDSKGNLRSIPQSAKTSAYVLVGSDAGKHIAITTGGVTLNTGTFSVGDVVSIYNNSTSVQTLTQGTSVTIYLAGTSSTGNRSIARRGIANLLCVDTNTYVVSGTGVS